MKRDGNPSASLRLIDCSIDSFLNQAELSRSLVVVVGVPREEIAGENDDQVKLQNIAVIPKL